MKTNRYMLVTMIPVMMLFACLIAYLVWFNLFRAKEISTSPYNRRMTEAAKNVIRGEIRSADGIVLARTETDPENNQIREYPEGRKYAHVVGYSTRGMSGLESAMNFELLSSHEDISEKIEHEIEQKESAGDNVITTLDSRLQESAWISLADWGIKKAAIVAIEPRSGRVLAMVSRPDFDPNSIDEEWDEITSDDHNSQLVNRVISGKYPPGSTYKTVVALEYLREHGGPDGFSYDCKDGYDIIKSVKMRCYDGEETHGEVNFHEAYYESCNKAFATMAVGLNQSEFVDRNEDLFFNKDIDFDLKVSKSRFGLTRHSDKSLIPQTAIGQGEVLMTPFHNALIMCAVANDGILMKPFLVDKIVSVSNSVVKQTKEKEYKQLMTAEEAKELQSMAREVVTKGTASRLSDKDYYVAGKTGTADVKDHSPHSWFVGYAGKEEGDADIVICVICENSGSGSRVAVPIAGEILDTFYEDVYGQ